MQLVWVPWGMSFLWQLEDHNVQAYWVHHTAVPLKAPPKPLNQLLVSVFPLPFCLCALTQDPPGCRTPPHQFPLLCFSCSVTGTGGGAWWGSQGHESIFILSSVMSLGRALLHSIHQLLAWLQGSLEGFSVCCLLPSPITGFSFLTYDHEVYPFLSFVAPITVCFLPSFSFPYILCWEVVERRCSALLGMG